MPSNLTGHPIAEGVRLKELIDNGQHAADVDKDHGRSGQPEEHGV
jgi:hypothetical protein